MPDDGLLAYFCSCDSRVSSDTDHSDLEGFNNSYHKVAVEVTRIMFLSATSDR